MILKSSTFVLDMLMISHVSIIIIYGHPITFFSNKIFLTKTVKAKEFDDLKKFNICFRYIVDLLCINNYQFMDEVMTGLYPEELELTSDYAVLQSHCLDLDLEIQNGQINFKLLDKCNAFGLLIVNYPDLSGNIPNKQSYENFVSKLIKYSRCCMSVEIQFLELKYLSKDLIKKCFDSTN
jgi:hypothetical protein